ncbi:MULTISPECIES: 50S ribosomal protein L29 [Ottowia]|jgi:ribosomal protein L29|uniref:Large ribosomal subunit protein uL29 n=1 Tax=Ottowia cancrivicina TaxID=3040346 RepID=A0AAW6RN43_9BURK|nr:MULTISPECIES: 50S ribosomal protein L29 [Ottowia]AKU66818.1 50S ribosomal protein L29 [Ottowia sp. oral taxon 894]MDG9700463.1 50S ribosomal protein L29 [Ottowia sp. 10c7w1]
MNAKELRQKDEAALKAEVKELQKAHFNLRMQKATQQLNNTSQLRMTRRAIARAKTILAEKKAAAK